MFFQAVSLCNCAVGLFVGNECVIIENTADSIEMLFEVMDRMGPKNHVLDRSPRRRHLANTVVYNTWRRLWMGTWGGDAVSS